MGDRRIVMGIAAVIVAALTVFLSINVRHERTGAGDDAGAPAADYDAVDAVDGGRTLTSKPGRFDVWLPGFPYRMDRELDSPFGRVMLHAFSHDGMRVSCSVAWNERAATDSRTLEQVLTDAGDFVAKAVGGSVLARRDVQLGPFPGTDAQVNAVTPRAGMYRVRAFVVGTRVYSMSAFMLPGAEVDPEVDRFFDSFEVIQSDGGVARAPSAPREVHAELADVVVSFLEESPPGTKRTLLVHRDGVVELTTGDRNGPVARRTAKGRADVAKLEKIFGAPSWAALAETKGEPSMYIIESHGRAVRRHDPIDTSETAFLDAMGALGELWIYAERAERPGAP